MSCNLWSVGGFLIFRVFYSQPARWGEAVDDDGGGYYAAGCHSGEEGALAPVQVGAEGRDEHRRRAHDEH